MTHGNRRSQAAAPGSLEIDDVDRRIVAELATDGRRSNRDVARALGRSERVVGERLRRLHDLGVMRIVTAVDLQAAGYETVINVGVRVTGRIVEDVARDLAAHPQVLSVLLMSGAIDIEIVVAARDQAALTRLVEQTLCRIPGIQSLSPSLRLRVLKVAPGMAPLVAPTGAPLDFPHDSPLDTTSRSLIHELWRDPQATNQAIAQRLQSSETTVRTRLADLRARGVVRITALSNLRVGEHLVFAAIGLDVASGELETVAAGLAGIDEIRFAVTVLGRHQVLAMAVAPSAAALAELAHARLSRLRGVTRAEATLALGFVKHDYRWAPLSALPPAD
jgi:Lrp/AsnC family leucine-responsive transcriptional regulator